MRQPLTPSVRKQNSSDLLGLFDILSLNLLLEIMYRLPVKSLLILKCVCKSLNSIISNPKFAKDQLRLSRTNRYDILLNTSDDSHIIIDSCDGIICFQNGNYNHGNLVVWNPCTRKLKVLPPLYRPALALKPLYSIGYDRFIDNYKVVAVYRYQVYSSSNFFKTQVRVHTLGTDIWRRISDFPSEIMGAPKGHVGKFVSGTINWAIKDQEKVSSWVILSLDLGNESYQKIMQPDFGLADPLHDFSLGVSRNCLCILAHTKDLLDFWVMKDYGNKDSWSKLFTVPFTELGYNGVDFVNLVYISEEHGLVFLDLCYKVYVYNYKNRTVQIPEIQDLPSTRFTSNYVYIESLISP